jgi:hypothetical protein
LPRTLYFSLLSFYECSVFLVLRLAFIFRLYFCSELVSSLYLGVFRPLVFVAFHLRELFQIGWLVLEKSKMFHAYSGAKGS